MTTQVMIHNPHRDVTVSTLDRVFEQGKPTDGWTRTANIVKAGTLHHTYCTETRKIEIFEE